MQLKIHPKILTLLAISLIWSTSLAQSPYGFRGPERSGSYPDTGLLKEWPEDGPELLWSVGDAGKGYSSPVIVGNTIYITGMNSSEDREILSAYRLTGEKIFQTEYGKPWDGTYPDTRTTPTIEGNRVYVISGSGEVVCLDAQSGAIVWKVDAGNLYERNAGNWGTSESPLVFDNKVIYTPSGDQTTMVALNAATGELVWKTKAMGDKGAYVSPLLISHNGHQKIIGGNAKSLFGVNPVNGNIDWAFTDWGSKEPGRDNIAVNTPLYDNGRIYFSSGYNIGSFMLQLNGDATNATLLWRNDDLDTHIGGLVLINGVIYGSNWINNTSGKWVAVEWNTGETLYEEEWSGGKSKGSIITADGMLYCYDERRGTVGLVKPNRQNFEVVSEFRITSGSGAHWGHPVIDNGILYIRRGEALMAFKIK